MPRKSYKLPPRSERCGCLLACNYYMLRCDNCHRGVHLACLKLSDPVADRPDVYVCTTCKNDGVEEARVAEIRAAEGKPCSVIFRGSCKYHVKSVYRGWKVLPLSDEHSDEVLSDALCDICHEDSCGSFNIACDNCDVYWHMHCVPITPEQAERIDMWYCERCRKTDGHLRITFKDGYGTEESGNPMTTSPPGPDHIAEEGGNVMTTPPPGPSCGASASVPAAQRKKRRTTASEATTSPEKKDDSERQCSEDRTARRCSLAKKNVLIAHLTAKLVDAGQL